MFKLKSAYIVWIPLSMLVFHVLYTGRVIPYASIIFFLLLIAPSGYVYPESVSYAIAALSWAVLCPACIIVYRVDPLNASLPILIFNALQAIFIWHKKLFYRENRRRVRELREREEREEALTETCEKASRFENGIKAKELSIVNLYEITKKMSEHLTFEDMFGAFSALLKDTFVFRKCDLLILKRDGEKLRVEREYSVWRQGVKDLGGKQADRDRLIALFSAGFRDVYIARDANAQAFKNLGIDNDAVATMAVLPLLSERKLVGILAVENLPKADLERFVILSMQFALEIKKVLLYEMVEKMAITDSLTGLYVRRYFYERFTEELQRSKRYGFPFAFLMIDIDDFKRCNDTYGHLVGDFVLKEIARIIRENVREIDIVARYGGEEISVVLPETQAENARAVADRVRKRIAENVFKAYDERLQLTISTGIAVYPEDAFEMKDLIDRADQALYEAKKSGKNVVCEYKKDYNNTP